MPIKIIHNNITGKRTNHMSFKVKLKNSNFNFLITKNNIITEITTKLICIRLKLISHKNIPAVTYIILFNRNDCCCSPKIKNVEKKVINR
ncbi:hypothetical protein ASZ90_006486 [hydrocarbon metagenome]|uniref:Uncharacterized protein n=1 Tax=hydrocarbon metagenome TaxID=938273 RepID=A0A0W8FRZ8_9ZZZZ